MDSISNSSSQDPNGNQLPSPPESNCNATSVQPVTKDNVAERQSRVQRQEEWAGKQTMSDVIFNKEVSEIVSIGGFKLDHFKHRMLIKFCLIQFSSSLLSFHDHTLSFLSIEEKI